MSANFSNVIDRNDAAALIPEETSRDIIQDMPRASAALSLFRQVRMSRKQQRLPVLSVLPTAYFVNGDTGLKQTSEQSWENKFLNAEELAVIVPVPEAVLDDSEFDIWGEVKPRVTEALGAAVDGAMFFGVNKPASWDTAIVAGAAAAGNTFTRGSVAGQKLDLDVNAVMTLLEEDGYDVNGFAARKSIKGGLRGLRTNDGGLLFQPTLQAGTPDTLYGESISYSQNGAWDNTQADLIAGDFSQGIIGLRQDVTYKVLDQAVITDAAGNIMYNLAQQVMIALRVVMRIAFVVPNPVNRMNQTGNRFPFATLRPTGFIG